MSMLERLVNSKFSQIQLFLYLKIWRKRITVWMNEWMRNKGVCRTALVILGLLESMNFCKFLLLYGAELNMVGLDDDTFGRWTQQGPWCCIQGLLHCPCLAKAGRLGMDDLYDLFNGSLTDRAGWACFPVLLGTRIATYLGVENI